MESHPTPVVWRQHGSISWRVGGTFGGRPSRISCLCHLADVGRLGVSVPENLRIGAAVSHQSGEHCAHCFAPFFFGLIVAAQMVSGAIGTVGAPLAAGIVLAIAVYSLSIFERRWHIARIGSGNGE